MRSALCGHLKMYEFFYGLRENPFNVTPNPKYHLSGGEPSGSPGAITLRCEGKKRIYRHYRGSGHWKNNSDSLSS